MLQTLQAEIEAGLPNLRGTRVTGEIPLRDTMLNEFIARLAPVGLLEFHDANRVVLKALGIVPVTATIVGVEAPLKVVFSVPFAARIGLMAFKSRLPRFVHVDGGHIIVDLAAAPQVAKYPLLARFVRLTRLSTSAGVLTIGFQIEVSE